MAKGTHFLAKGTYFLAKGTYFLAKIISGNIWSLKNLIIEAVPLAVAAYPIRSLLLPHLEGEEAPGPFPCAAVRWRGEPHRCQEGDRPPLREDLPLGGYNFPCCLEALCIIVYYRNYIIKELYIIRITE